MDKRLLLALALAGVGTWLFFRENRRLPTPQDNRVTIPYRPQPSPEPTPTKTLESELFTWPKNGEGFSDRFWRDILGVDKTPKKAVTGGQSDTGYRPPPKAFPYLTLIRKAEKRYNIPQNLLVRVIEQESGFNPNAVSPVGAVGLAQIMPATAAQPGYGVTPIDNPRDPKQAIPFAAQYLRAMYNRFGSWEKALAAYNWGPGAVQQYGLTQMPAETRQYVANITADVPVA